MSILSKIKEAVLCLKAGCVTLPYPARAEPVPKTFRGRPVFDANKCIGCAGCANNCPAREILAGGGRKIVMLLDRVRSRIIPMPDAPWYRNLNTQEEYAQWVQAGTL